MQKILLLVLLSLGIVRAGAETITLDGQGPGRTFEGLGALSAGASSRLLLDYPEPQRTEILDFLFKPNFGASLQHLKVEIGGDMNSTDGTEPSHARTREEFEHPKPEYFDRGYEWWLMKEAKKRNPHIYLDVLQWGAPGWIGDKDFKDGPNPAWTYEELAKWNAKKFYTQDNADSIVSFIQGAKKYHDLTIDFCGIWNERPYDAAWIKLLRQTLDRNGLNAVKVVAADQINRWNIVDDFNKDPELKKSVDIVGVHYPSHYSKPPTYKSTPAAIASEKPLWSSEDGVTTGDWAGACVVAKIFNRNYIEGRMTKTIIWSVVTSYSNNLPSPDSGRMMARTPWSGNYEVQPAIWANAHTTQFAQPGWKYIDAACGVLEGSGSYVSLRSPESDGNYSIIIETVDAKKPQTFSWQATGGLATGPVHVWRSNAESQFDQQGDVSAVDGSFSLVLEPGSIYTLTTTTGQHKGETKIPPPADFPSPYQDDFENRQPGKLPRYFADQVGVFEIASRPDGSQCLQQIITSNNIEWRDITNAAPMTIIGPSEWQNYEVSCDVLVEKSGYASVCGRIPSYQVVNKAPLGYSLKLYADGRWELCAYTETLASGTVPTAANQWHKLSLTMIGPKISAGIDGVEVKSIENWDALEAGMAGLGSGLNQARFDNFALRKIPGPAWVNLALKKKVTVTGNRKDAPRATDGDVTTFWQPQDDWATSPDFWIKINLGKPTAFNRVRVRQAGVRIEKYRIEYLDGTEWKEAFSGVATEPCWSAGFPSVTAGELRLRVLSTRGGDTPAIAEIEVYDEDQPGK